MPSDEAPDTVYTVKVEDTAFATNKQGSEKFTITNYDDAEDISVKGVWSTKDAEGARLIIEAPRGWKLDTATAVTADGATLGR